MISTKLFYESNFTLRFFIFTVIDSTPRKMSELIEMLKNKSEIKFNIKRITDVINLNASIVRESENESDQTSSGLISYYHLPD